jgi:hypothetical protein
LVDVDGQLREMIFLNNVTWSAQTIAESLPPPLEH